MGDVGSATMAPTTRASSPPSRPAYMPGLDGVRAISVAAVFLFHAGVLRGGFIGVDVFFVVSGFLITGLAVVEIETIGRLALGRFWARRARRLLPALFVVLAACVGYLLIVDRGSVVGLRDDITSTLLYVSNWSEINAGSDYFAEYTDRSPLEHTWSLAIEEQFYLVWPILLVAVATAVRRRPNHLRPAVAVTAGIVAVASVLWTTRLAGGGADVSRLYYGTDTRLVGMALGAIAACVLLRGGRRATTARGHVVTAITSAAVPGWLALNVDGGERWLYGPGFALIAVASVGLIVAATGSGPIAGLLSVGPLVAIGRVSYGIYLWHWPVIVVLTERRVGLSGLSLGAVWVAATAALTTMSWYLVERRAPLPSIRRPARVAAYAAAGCLTLTGAIAVADHADRPVVEAEDVLASGEPAFSAPARAQAPTSDPGAPNHPSTDPARRATVPDRPAAEPARPSTVAHLPATTTPPDDTTSTEKPPADLVHRELPADRPLRVLVLGDSVAWTLEQPDAAIEIDRVGPVEIVNHGLLACPVDPAGDWVFGGETVADPQFCEGANRFADEVAAADPDLIVTLFGWPGINDRILDDGSTVRPCEPGFDARWGREYRELVDRLSTAGPVVVSTVAYYRGDAYDRADDRTDCLNDELDDHDFTLFDLAGWVCPGGDCSTLAALRPDGLHFDVDGELEHAVWTHIVTDSAQAAGFRLGP